MKLQIHAFTLLTVLCGLGLTGCGKSGAKGSAAAESVANARLEAIRQSGQPVTLAELNAWYPELPAAENRASLYAEAFAALKVTDAKSPSYLRQNQPVLVLLHKAGAPGQCRYPLDLSAGAAAQLPHLANIKTCAQLLGRDAVDNAARGKFDQATQDVLDGLRLAQSLEQEPLLISQLVRVSAYSLLQSALEEAVGLKAFPDERLAQMQSALLEQEDTIGPSLMRAFVSERCLAISLFRMPLADFERLVAGSGTNFSFGSSAQFDQYRKSSLGQADLVCCLDYFSNWLAVVVAPFPANLELAAQWSPQADAQIAEARAKGYRVASLMLPSLNSSIERAADCVAQLRAARTALAAERYRLAGTSALASPLAQLVPKYLPAVPSDPYDGQPLRYKKLSPKGYVVYSLGRNRQDDGGIPKPPGGKADGPYDLTFAVRR